MDNSLSSKLEALQADYKEIKGKPFDHFFCPILFKDENVSLCKGHIINQPFRNSSRARTVQRKDIDSFYGSMFEADFTDIQDADKLSRGELLKNKTLFKRISPRILRDGEEVDFYVARENVPKNFTKLKLKQDGHSIPIGLKMSPEEVLASRKSGWQFDTSKDLRIAGIVSLIKMAHLTLFETLGYSYALSTAGYFIGKEILGKFFEKNYNQSKKQVLANARSFFQEYVNIARPLLSCGLDLKGTIVDRWVAVCWGSSGAPWAMIVFIRTGHLLQSVMVPIFDHVEAVDTFLSFLCNEHDSISVTMACFNKRKGKWDINPKQLQWQWPKTDESLL